MAPNYASKLVFEGKPEWADDDYILEVSDSDYTLTASIDDLNDRDVMNYYYTQQINFNIIKCEAVINFPANNNFEYNGSSIDFLNSITITLKDIYGGRRTITYSQALAGNSIDLDALKFQIASTMDEYTGNSEYPIESYPYPWDVGSYILTLRYEDKSYASELSTYTYNIVSRPYSGNVKPYQTVMEYNPLKDYSAIYTELIKNIKIDQKPVWESDVVESVTIFYAKVESYLQEASLDPKYILPSDEGLSEEQKQELVKMIMVVETDGANVIPHVLTYKVVYKSNTLSDEYRYDASLLITKKKMSASSFSNNTSQNLVYSGNPIYCGLTYGGVDMSPHAPETQVIGNSTFTINTQYNPSSKIYTVASVDGLENDVVQITYRYVIDGTSTAVEKPIVPNTYRMYYTIQAGPNYSMKMQDGSSSISDDVSFTINKARSINVSISAITGLSYTGGDLTDAIIEMANMSAKSTNNIDVIRRDVHLEKVNQGKPTGTSNYSIDYGILIYYYIYQDDSNTPLSQVVHAGNYHLRVFCPGGVTGYNIDDYTDELLFNGDSYADIDFTIAKQSFTMTAETLKDTWYIQSGNQTMVDDDLYVETTLVVNVISTHSYNGNTLFQISSDYAICVKAYVDGYPTQEITDFESMGFGSDLFGSSNKAFVYVYKYNLLDDVERSNPIIVQLYTPVLPEPEP